MQCDLDPPEPRESCPGSFASGKQLEASVSALELCSPGLVTIVDHRMSDIGYNSHLQDLQARSRRLHLQAVAVDNYAART